MMRVFTLISLLLLLAACDSGAGIGANAVNNNDVIQWERSPETVVFRAQIVGGEESFLARNEIPPCTVYGDNRVVWLNELGDYDVQVLWDSVTDQQIRDFISFLTISQRVFTYDAGADLQPPSSITPVMERIEINVNDRQHVTDSFSREEWPGNYFAETVEFCKQISRAPVLFEPTGAWLTVRSVPYDSTRPMLVWDGEAAGLDFNEVAQNTEPTWLTDRNMRVLWNMIRSSSPSTLFTDLVGNAFEVVLEVPGVNPTAPPAP